MIEFLSSVLTIIDAVFLCGYISWLLLPVKIPVIFFVLFAFLNSAAFFIGKEGKNNLHSEFILYRVDMIALTLAAIKRAIQAVEQATYNDMPGFICFFIYFAALAVTGCLLFVDSKKKEAAVKNADFVSVFSVKKKKDKESGDVILCVDAETGEDVILAGEDRLLHMFIDGPTGCGKTAQILTPMIEQDIRNGYGVTVIEPKGDFAKTAYAIAEIYGRKDAILFNPIDPDCPPFNVLSGPEDEVVETLSSTFQLMTPDSQTYFKDISDVLIRHALMVLKRLEEAYYDENTGRSDYPATLINLSDLLNNPNGRGETMIRAFNLIPAYDDGIKKQNEDVGSYFTNDYYKEGSVIYKNTSGIRTQVAKLVQNKYLRKVLNPEDGRSAINFDDALRQGRCVFISTDQGKLRGLSSYIGYFLIFSYQAAVFRRKRKEREHMNFLYVDEAQKFVTGEFSEILEQGRSYRVGAILATQARSELGNSRNNKQLLESISSNARNNVVFPGISAEDRMYYEKLFGEVSVIEERRSESTPKWSFMQTPKSSGSETTSYVETKKSLYTGTDIAYKKFSEITYSIIVDKSLQRARNGIASFIDQDLKEEVDSFIDRYEDRVDEGQNEYETDLASRKKEVFSNFYEARKKGEVKVSGKGGGRGIPIVK